MPKLTYVDEIEAAEDAEVMDTLFPTAETIQRYRREAGIDTRYNIMSAVNAFIRPHEGTMAEFFLESQDPWDDDWGNQYDTKRSD